MKALYVKWHRPLWKKRKTQVYHVNTLHLHASTLFHNPLHTPFSVILWQKQQDFHLALLQKNPQTVRNPIVHFQIVILCFLSPSGKKTVWSYFYQN